MLRLYDTTTGDVRDLVPREPGVLSLYVCGPTVYDLPHLGHGRYTLVWDMARRWFTFRGYTVRFVSNITDIDDNIIARARREGVSEKEIATQFENEWWRAMDAIGVARPDVVPHATDYVESMVRYIELLLERDIAYITSDGVYFDVSRVPDYGLLAGQPLDSLRAGARVEAHDEKRSPLDFALWKKAKPDEPTWPASFGEGRPGWHTECVVMSLDTLGEGFDLHTGGLDLKFPHHENERAQAIAGGHVFAQHWNHSGWVMVGDEKMSKSLGNFTSLTDLLTKTDARAYRLLVLRSHYRSPIEVSPATITDAERALERLDALARRFSLVTPEGFVNESLLTTHTTTTALREVVMALLDDDLDTPAAVARLFDAVSEAHAAADGGDLDRATHIAHDVMVFFGALGLRLDGTGANVDAESATLAAQRDDARRRKDFAEADRLRDELVSRGWIVEDSAHGTVLRPV